MRLDKLIDIVEKIAPPHLAMEGDPVGLQLGDRTSEVKKALVCLDATKDAQDEAVRIGADVVLCHHPLIYHPLQNIDETDPHKALIAEYLRRGVAVYSLHTNWDIVENGLNDVLAEALGITNTRPLEITRSGKLYKIVVFVPTESMQSVRQALGDAGAGAIGDYSHCTFRTVGTGGFLPGDTANPHIGSKGNYEEVEEYRLETICSEEKLDRAVDAMLRAHPYEEVAYDITLLNNAGKQYGLGRVGQLETPVTFEEFQARVFKALGGPVIRASAGDASLVARVAVCGGSGASLIGLARSAGADVYVTAELGHHDILLARSLGLAVIDATHLSTEQPGMKHFAELIRNEVQGQVEVEFLTQT